MAVVVPERGLSPGRSVLVLYEGDAFYHERVLLARSHHARWSILTPDGDLYIEDLAEMEECWPMGDAREPPRALAGAQLYLFQGWFTAAEAVDIFARGEVMADLDVAQAGAPPVPRVRPPGFEREFATIWRRPPPVDGAGVALAVPLRVAPGPAPVAAIPPLAGAAAAPRLGGMPPAPPAPPAAAVAAAAVAAPAVPGRGVWLFAEPATGVSIGDPSPAPQVTLGGKGLVNMADGSIALVELVEATDTAAYKDRRVDLLAQEVGDLRTLPVKWEGNKRYREFPNAVDLLVETGTLDSFPEGGRTVLWYLREMRRRGLVPEAHHREWRQSSGVQSGDRSIFEHSVLMTALSALLCIDQVNAPNLVAAEVIIRRAQVIEEAHAISPTSPDYSAAEVMMGLGRARGAALVAPSLAAHTAHRLRDEAQLHKERRLATEERNLRRGGGGGAPAGGGSPGKK